MTPCIAGVSCQRSCACDIHTSMAPSYAHSTASRWRGLLLHAGVLLCAGRCALQ